MNTNQTQIGAIDDYRDDEQFIFVCLCCCSLNCVTVETNPAEIFGPFMFQEPRRVQSKALGSGVIVTKRCYVVDQVR